MLSRFIRVGGMIGLVLGLFIGPVMTVSGQSATGTTWTSSISYYNTSDTGGNLVIAYHAEGSSTPVATVGLPLTPHQAGSLYIGSVGGIPDSWLGSIVMYSDVPIISTYVQYAAGDLHDQYGRPMYSGFPESGGSTTFYIPTFLYQKFGSTSMIAIQNVDTADITANAKVYPAGSGTPIYDQDHAIPPGASEVLDAAEMGLSPGLNSSVVITATGEVAAVSLETYDAGRPAYAFEGFSGGATTVYMATMLCNAFGAQQQTVNYAIQNVGTISTDITVDFYDTAGSSITTTPPIPVPAGSKTSVLSCDYVPDGTTGSAMITSTGEPVIAMGKASSATGMVTAFVGQTAGATKVAAPYVRWSADPYADWRSNVAVTNVGAGDATDILVRYYDASGNLAGSEVLATVGDPLPSNIKRNTNPETAGALDANGNFGINPYGGALEVASDQPVIVLVRTARQASYPDTTLFAEDYNGSPVP